MGIHFNEHGEYGVVTNCSFIDNYVGALMQGGNNIISGSAFERNTNGAIVNGTNIDNSGHGAFIGCSFNHNTAIGLQVISTNNGYVISGCQIFRNDSLDLGLNAKGVNVSGSNFGLSSKLSINSNTVLSITGCMFGSQPTMEIIEGAKIKGINNYTFEGNAVSSLNTL